MIHTIEVHDCRKCPFRRSHLGHGEKWEYCSHKEAPSGFGNIIPYDYAGEFPQFCPGKPTSKVKK